MNISPENIQQLEENEVFVFGSNLAGIHGAGAARVAYEKFGAVLGQGHGWNPQTYALPTKDEKFQTLPLEVLKIYIQRFEAFAIANPDLRFLVTEIGCGLAGYSPLDVAPLFQSSYQLPNVYMPKRFWDIHNDTYKG